MSATDVRNDFVDELRRMWLGPLDGPNEVLSRNPVYAYLVGTLYPVEEGAVAAAPTVLDEDIEAGVLHGENAEVVDDELDVGGERPDEDDDPGLSLVGAFGWAPQSMGMSFIHDGDAIIVSVDAGAYREDESAETSGDEPTDGPREAWRREDVSQAGIRIPTTAHGKQSILQGRADLAWRTRTIGEKRLTTIAVSNAANAAAGKAKSDPTKCLFQVRIRADIESGRMHPYPTSNPVTSSDEDRELDLRYRSKPTYAIGHGTAVVWDDGEAPGYAMTETVPRQEVPAVRARVSTLQALELAWLADESVSAGDLGTGLRAFLDGYRSWVSDREQEAASLPSRFEKPAAAILERMSTARDRIEAGIRLLESGGSVLTAFRLANRAMRTQMLQQRWARSHAGRIGVPLEPAPAPATDREEPRWHPFQLGFILLSLASTTDNEHEDRELVDLIWFPTGGGKTEAYLGLAAIEMIRRRLDRGVHGGGTAVLTRYTMRLLTAQQFQRAATLICALELLRSEDDRLAGTPSFSIGLWLGNTTTPGTYEQAADQMKRVLREKSPQNPFQFRQCSWCGTSIMPERQSRYEELYGVRATKFSFQFFCPHAECPFHAKLPVQVVDEGIFEDPPTMLVATVDKFARLAWIDQGASMFGLGGVPYDPPSLVIQDELHLIAGPLGTIVGIYEAAIRGLMSWKGTAPKVVASTATTRASADQIRELMASKVAVFPPSGLDADDSYFAEPDPDRAGRMYVGIMPQAHTPSWALGQISTEMLNAPVRLGMSGAELDAYWTLVVYHNSLRELGRTVTILRDDVRAALDRRADRDDGPTRTLAKDGIEELNGNVSSDELLRILEQLGEGPESGGKPLDALATTNIMSVGIDVSRLGLMLVNGQPKSTSEYIQATSRVGRGDVPGLVVTMYRSGKPRDRSVFESFTAYHRAYYRFVEPGTVTPWSLQARRRALRAALVILVRHGAGLSVNDSADRFESDASAVKKAVDVLTRHVEVADRREATKVADELQKALDDWEHRVEDAGLSGTPLKYRSFTAGERLLKQFTDSGAGWSTMNSMRSVDRVVRVRADGER